MALLDFLWPVWALQMCLFMIIFANICKYCQVLCCCVLRPSIFDVYRLFAYFTKVCAPKITIFFHFFRSIASCDHQLTSEGQLLRPFSLLLAILPFSYDFSNKKYLQIKYFNITFCLETDILGFCKHILLAYFANICIFSPCFVCF